MKQAIIVDIDGTLADCSHRLHFIKKKPKDWVSFHGRVSLDEVNQWCERIVNRFFAHGDDVILISGRAHDSLDSTIRWLRWNHLWFSEIYVREPGDYRDDHIVKKELYERHVKGKYDVLFVIEDRKRVVDMWRAEGLVCLQCADGNF